MIQLKNDWFCAQINPQGAELCSLRRRADESEWIWQADAAYWPGHAPTLFPITGKLRGGQYTHEGKRYELPPHGFAKESVFTVERRTQSEAVFTLRDSAETRRCYPFAFAFSCTFRLTERGLAIVRRAENRGGSDMYCSMGEHLGLSLQPLGTGLDECCLRFDRPQTLWNWRLEQGLLAQRVPFGEGVEQLPLSEELFRRWGCLVLQGFDSDWVELCAPGRGTAVRVSCGGFPAMVVWNPANGGNFVCVEPWQGLPSSRQGDDELRHRPGILTVCPGQAAEYTVCIEPRG